ncbi:hypothetical protein LP415_20785 [Polaromonas sp. P1(28)-8]|nr:hypothetical protein LP415_20785 [Polaromonas sp. P1(28)-8]
MFHDQAHIHALAATAAGDDQHLAVQPAGWNAVASHDIAQQYLDQLAPQGVG